MKPPGSFLAMHSISKELGLKSLMHLKREILSSTFLMEAESKHHSDSSLFLSTIHVPVPIFG
jgi:hypothetical protein